MSAPTMSAPLLGLARRTIASAPLFTPSHLSKTEYLHKARRGGDAAGVTVAALIISGWGGAVGTALFAWDVHAAAPWRTACLAAAVQWLYAGLFITAHDAMHGLVAPGLPRLNNALGWLCVRCYAMFDYELLVHAHWAHHRHSGHVGKDPDFHDGEHTSALMWYLHFMREYMTVSQLALMGVAFNALHFALGVPFANMMLLWVMPSLLSSLQLFYYGTFLPHREPEGGWADDHRATTHPQSLLWAFFSCFFFGLHSEHHNYPFVPWFRLPMVSSASALPSLPSLTTKKASYLLFVLTCAAFTTVQLRTFTFWAGWGAAQWGLVALHAAPTAIFMEYVYRSMHRDLWHHSFWFLHSSHHGPKSEASAFELNDLNGVLQALPVLICMAYTARLPPAVSSASLLGVLAGVSIYGCGTTILHDGIFHQRFAVGPLRDVATLQKIAAAHQAHHAADGQGVYGPPHGFFLAREELEAAKVGKPTPGPPIWLQVAMLGCCCTVLGILG